MPEVLQNFARVEEVDALRSEVREVSNSVNALTADVARISSAVEATSKSVGTLATTQNSLAAKLNDSNQTNWGWIISGVLALGGFITLYVQPVRSAVEDIGQRLWAVETSRFSQSEADRRFASAAEGRSDIAREVESIRRENADELIDRAKWMGGTERDVQENAHELDLMWNWRHTKADTAIDQLLVRVKRLEDEQRYRRDIVLNEGGDE